MALDALLALVWVGCLVYGFGSGLLRSLTSAIAVYLGLVVASQLFDSIASSLVLVAGSAHQSFLRATAYLLSFAVATVVLVVLGYLVYPATRLERLGRSDQLGGAGMAAVGGTVLVAALLVAVQFLAVVTWPFATDVNRALETSLEESRLRPLLLEQAPLLPPAILTWAPKRSDTLHPAARTS